MGDAALFDDCASNFLLAIARNEATKRDLGNRWEIPPQPTQCLRLLLLLPLLLRTLFFSPCRLTLHSPPQVCTNEG